MGATWLDKPLLSDRVSLAAHGVGAEGDNAMRAGVDLRVDLGLAELRSKRFVRAPNLAMTLLDRKLAVANEALQQTGEPTAHCTLAAILVVANRRLSPEHLTC